MRVTASAARDVESALDVMADASLSDDDVVQNLRTKGLPFISAEKLVVWVPIAFGFVLLGHGGLTDLPFNLLIKSLDGEWVSLPIGDEPYFQEALQVAVVMAHEGPRRVFEPIALRSSHVRVVNDALNRGLTIEDIRSGNLSEAAVIRIDLEAWVSG